MAYHMPAQGTKDSYALDMLTTLLSGGESSRLTKRLVDKDKLAVQVASFPLPLEDPGLFLMLAVANAGKTLREVENVMQEEIERVKNEQMSESEFQRSAISVNRNSYRTTPPCRARPCSSPTTTSFSVTPT